MMKDLEWDTVEWVGAVVFDRNLSFWLGRQLGYTARCQHWFISARLPALMDFQVPRIPRILGESACHPVAKQASIYRIMIKSRSHS